jgi:hypothetical protein
MLNAHNRYIMARMPGPQRMLEAERIHEIFCREACLITATSVYAKQFTDH